MYHIIHVCIRIVWYGRQGGRKDSSVLRLEIRKVSKYHSISRKKNTRKEMEM